MKQAELNTLMEQSAVDAVRAADEQFNIALDFSKESVGLVDNILLLFVEQQKPDTLADDAIFTICNIYGAYTGECYRKLAGGQWRYDESDEKAPYVVLDVGDKSYAFASICYERMVNDANVSLARYFELALNHQLQ